MVRVTLCIRNTHFTIQVNDDLKEALEYIHSSLVTYDLIYDKFKKRMRRVVDKQYYVYDSGEECYRYNINCLLLVIGVLKSRGIKKEEFKIIKDRVYDIDTLEATTKKDYIPRDYQIEYINRLVDPVGHTARLVDLVMGKGKSLIATFASVTLNMKLGILVLPKYKVKWKYDILTYTDITSDEILMIQGNDMLDKYLTSTEEDEYKVIIMSIPTMLRYIKNYLNNPFSTPVPPTIFTEKTRIGNIINDEAHQHFHAVYTILLLLNPAKVIGLSATLINNDKYISKMYNFMYPPEARINNILIEDNYIYVWFYSYKVYNSHRLQYKIGTNYNHNQLEQSILHKSVLTKDYMNMIKDMVDLHYINRKTKGKKERVLIFVASINLATVLCNFLTKTYKKLDVRRYVEDDPFKNVLEPDICVSTVLSSGTAIDIKGLITVIQTISIGSIQSSRQAMGRLREIKGTDVRYVCLHTPDIPNQRVLTKAAIEALTPVCKKIIHKNYNKILRG